MKKPLLLVSAIGLTLSACSGKSGSKGSTTKTMAREAYLFEYNGCSTGEQEFIHTNAEEARRMLCEGLQNEELNKGCARPLRRDHFELKCHGFGQFTPRFREEVRPQPEPRRPDPIRSEPDHTLSRDHANESRVRDHLAYMVAEDLRIAPNLNVALAEQAQNLVRDASDCGLDPSGLNCTIGTIRLVENKLHIADGQRTFVSIFQTGEQLGAVFIAPVESLEPLKVKSFEIRKLLKAYDFTDLMTFASNPKNATTIVTGVLADDFRKASLQKLANPRNARELYYSIMNPYRSVRQSAEELRERQIHIARAIENNTDLVYRANEKYQIDFIRIIDRNDKIRDSKKIEIFERLLKAGSGKVSHLAAAHLLKKQPSRTDIRDLVATGMDSPDVSIRLECIEAAIAAREKSPELRSKILRKLDDKSDYIRGQVIRALGNEPVSEADIPELRELLNSAQSDTRLAALELLLKIPGQGSMPVVIDHIERETSEYVRGQVFRGIERRGVRPQDAPGLMALLAETRGSDKKIFAAEQLGRIPGNEVTIALVNAMDDSSEYVRGQINQQLDKREMNGTILPALQKMILSKKSDVRLQAAELIAKIQSKEALHTLILALPDKSEYVRGQLVAKLKRKRMTDSEVIVLKPLLNSDQSDVRIAVAELLGKVGNQEARKALEDRLKIETSEYVKGQITRVLEGMR